MAYEHSLQRHISVGEPDEGLLSHFSFDVGDGSSLFFWWLGGGHRCFDEAFEKAFLLGAYRDASIADYRELVFSINAWSHVFVQDGFVQDDSLVNFLKQGW